MLQLGMPNLPDRIDAQIKRLLDKLDGSDLEDLSEDRAYTHVVQLVRLRKQIGLDDSLANAIERLHQNTKERDENES